ERKKMEEGLRYSNEHDNWTGLHNRRYLEKYLIHENTKREKFKKALISINLSELHALSITYGFNYHQEVVKKVAKTLSYFGSDRCSLFHISENRFLFYLKKYEDKGELNAFCDVVSDTLESLLSIEGVGGGIGVVEINSNSKPEIDTLITNTMIASEKVDDDYDRDFGYCFFDKEMETRIMREEQIKYDLTQISGGIDTDRLFLLFQPIIDLKTGKVWGFEALARLDSKELGLVSPLEFIPIAEKTKLIIPLGELIIRKSFHFLKQLRAEGYDEYNVSINISAIQLMRSDFSKNIFEIMGEMAVNPENVCIEITESIFTTNYHEINKILGELKQLGVKSAIDDFGTGYSSFAREWELNVNSLKIDRYFVNKLLSLQSLEEAITGDIISMAHKLGHLVIAEGVEEESQKEYLRSKGCDKIQGYLISKPLALGKAIEFLKSYD
ncbi:MAG TPA: bifunctional diguanylate cyclase/phosphodiesterase, partial [Anaerovoracaceae bacterium]|nr:bifunctional diguanylate cyclase/phosphodiesterase [Anaerovoracaceae bacterium]